MEGFGDFFDKAFVNGERGPLTVTLDAVDDGGPRGFEPYDMGVGFQGINIFRLFDDAAAIDDDDVPGGKLPGYDCFHVAKPEPAVWGHDVLDSFALQFQGFPTSLEGFRTWFDPQLPSEPVGEMMWVDYPGSGSDCLLVANAVYPPGAPDTQVDLSCLVRPGDDPFIDVDIFI